MPSVNRVSVVDPVSTYTILVTKGHADLPEDGNWDGSAIADPGNAVLYDAGQEHERPFAFSTKNNQWTLDIEIHDIGNEFIGQPVRLVFSDKNTYAQKSDPSASIVHHDSTVNISESTTVLRVSGNGISPFGFFGEYEVAIRPNGESTGASWAQTIRLEAYYLSAPMLPKFFDLGIPLLFLRMLVLPQATRKDSRSVETWIEDVTKIVFGSTMPFDRRPTVTKDHWLVYNTTGGGAPSFTSAYGGQGLNLDAWLDAYRNWKKHGVVTRVNCYDQAAATEVALCLGISHEQIHWEYHQKYGFIDTELVGWGRVNSPYFDNEETWPVYEKKDDPARQPFRNHAYLSWSNFCCVKYRTDSHLSDPKDLHRSLAT